MKRMFEIILTWIRPVSASAVAFVRTIVTFVAAVTLVSPVHANSSVLGKGGYDRKIDHLALELPVHTGYDKDTERWI